MGTQRDLREEDSACGPEAHVVGGAPGALQRSGDGPAEREVRWSPRSCPAHSGGVRGGEPRRRGEHELIQPHECPTPRRGDAACHALRGRQPRLTRDEQHHRLDEVRHRVGPEGPPRRDLNRHRAVRKRADAPPGGRRRFRRGDRSVGPGRMRDGRNARSPRRAAGADQQHEQERTDGGPGHRNYDPAATSEVPRPGDGLGARARGRRAHRGPRGLLSGPKRLRARPGSPAPVLSGTGAAGSASEILDSMVQD